MRDSGIRNARHKVHLRQVPAHDLVTGHDLPVSVAHDLHIHTLVVGVGIAVISPEEGADFQVFPRRGEGFVPVGSDPHDLGRTKLVHNGIFELLRGKRLKTDAIALMILPDDHRKPPMLVPRGQNAPVAQHQQHCHRTVDDLLHVTDALDKAVPLIDERSNQLRAVDPAGAHGLELMPVIGKIRVDQLLVIVDLPDGRDGVQPQVRADQQRLRVGIADAAEAARTGMKAREILFKLGSERGVRDGMDLPGKTVFRAPDRHTGVPRAEVAVVVRAEKHVQSHIAPRNGAEKPTHQAKKSSDSVIGSIYLPSL